MGDRWRLNRAGITNVYQYADETLTFGGGRLLLRGVNGSGKSTAMNMLLPFLLDANTRRIDAAGEQSSVLRSWMLSGRDEQQPVGYLWIELARGDEHFVCGCGIRANRSTDRVTTWWFATSKRPGIDVALVEGRVPLSVDALRIALGPHAVFTHDQRGAYRAEVRARLFGGADLDQHIRLLHVVRNPRVGDRIDVDLPSYLEDALPQLSESAIDDAAQPLEDLEEHRRNVEDIARTATALDALHAVYESYARAELRRRASELLERAGDARAARRRESQATTRAQEARERYEQAEATVESHEADERRLREEIATLQDAPAYQAGQSMEDLRRLVAALSSAMDAAAARASSAASARRSAADRLEKDRRAFDSDGAALADVLADLSLLATSVTLSARPGDAPSAATAVLDAGGHAGGTTLIGPDGPFEIERSTVALGQVRAATAVRHGDVDVVRRALADAAIRDEQVARADEALERSRQESEHAAVAFGETREVLAQSTEQWRADVRDWLAQGHGADDPVPDRDLFDLDRPDLADAHAEISHHLLALANTTVDHHQRVTAELRSRRELELAEMARLDAEHLELSQRSHPDTPTARWQRAATGPRLADLVDFAAALGDADRVGLEAAMEAAGLLGAEIGTDGSLALTTGELIVAPTQQADAPLSGLLTITIPDELAGDVDETLLAKVLDSISTDPNGTATTMVATNGTFRLGAVHGRHAKDVAEHVGVTARRAALERQRVELQALLDVARTALDRTDEAITRSQDQRRAAIARRDALPSAAPIIEARQRADWAEQQLETARERVTERAARVTEAETARAEAEAEARRVAVSMGLPSEADELARVERTLTDIVVAADRASAALTTAQRAHGHWVDAARAWIEANAAHERATEEQSTATRDHEPAAVRLATLEDSIGLAYAEILQALAVSTRDLEQTALSLRSARSSLTTAAESAATSRADVATATAAGERAEAHCVAGIPSVREALDVPGLLAAALTLEPDAIGDRPEPVPAPGGERAPDAKAAASAAVDAGADPVGAAGAGASSAITFVPVAESADGARALADEVLRRVPPPERDLVTAESVRQSLRQRRDTLGSGWDAEDHQRAEHLPVLVEVTGPLGQMPLADARHEVRSQLRHQSSLLTAKQDQALRNLLQGLIAREVAEKLHAARELVALMNERLDTVTTSHGIGAGLRWRRKADTDPALAGTIDLLAKPPDLRTADENHALASAMSVRIEEARRLDPEVPYRQLIGEVLDYRRWHQMSVLIRRPGQAEERLTRRTPLSEGEKKMVSYLPLFAAVAASCDALAASAPDVPRFVLLDDAFAKVSEDNHANLFGLLVDMDLDFIATSERLWGTHATVPELAITEVIRDAQLGVIVLEHSHWDGRERSAEP